MTQRRWICPRCHHVKRTSTSVTSTYCVADSTWYDLIGLVDTDTGVTMSVESRGGVTVETVLDEETIRPIGGWN